jgi:outer membrane protein OmpA-like peptidoglycan-associated protein
METERLSKLSAAELEVIAKQKELEALEAKKVAMAALEKEQALKSAAPNRKQDANLTAMETDKTQQLSAAELALIAERKEAEALEIRKLLQIAIERETTLAKAEPNRKADLRLSNLATDSQYDNLTIEEKKLLLAKKEAELEDLRIAMASKDVELKGSNEPNKKTDVRLSNMATDQYANLTDEEKKALLAKKESELIALRENIAAADKNMVAKANAEPNRKTDVKLSNLETDDQYANLTAEEKANLLAKKEKLNANSVQKDASMENKEVKLKTKEVTRRQDVRLDNMETDDKLDLSEIKPLIAPKFNYYLDELSIFEGKKIKSRTVYSQIYFRFDDSHVSNINYKIMDKLIDYAKKYPNVKIEITATTDNVGTEDYNKALAYRRGKSTWDYMLENGVNHEQLIINPIGVDERATPQDKPTDRWKYRRVDFHIIVLEP